MGKKKKTEKKVETVEQFLNRLVKMSRCNDDGNWAYTTPEEHSEALQAGLVEVNDEMTNEDDTALATMLTEAGLKAIGADMKTTSEAFDFTPPKTARGRKAAECPLDLEGLEAGKAYFVADAEKTGKSKLFMHVKRINDKYSVPTEAMRLNKLGQEVPKKAHGRVYRLIEGEKDGVKGCFVTRTK